MSEVFNVLEIARMAVEIEKQGFEYYNKVAQSTKDEKTKAIFQILAEQEKKHIEQFTNLYNFLADISDVNDEYLFDEHVTLYLQALTENQVFKNSNINEAASVPSAKEAVQEGLKAEKNAVLFYSEIAKNTKLQEVKNILELIVDEEKQHIIDLNTLMKSI